MAATKYTEQDTNRFYNAEDAHYRAFWDQAGSLHWGVFDETTGRDFLKACANLNAIMARRGRIEASSRVLDIGCGNGNTARWLADTTGCHVVGVDSSIVRVENARSALAEREGSLRERVSFDEASATALPYADASFSHVWSQATIYHVHDKQKVLAEAARVVQPGGIFVFDDLTKPRPDVSDEAREYVYDRLLFDTDFSFDSYQDALKGVGFTVLEARDLSEHLGTSYALLADKAARAAEGGDAHFAALSSAYRKMVQCIENREVGWAMFVCRK